MSVYKRGKIWQVEVNWRGVGLIRATTLTTKKRRAKAMEHTLAALYSAGRTDLLGLLTTWSTSSPRHRLLTLPELHEAWQRGPEALEQLRAKAESPELGQLVDEWLAWLESPAGISNHTRRPYAPQSIRRYSCSWEGFFEVLPNGRGSRLTDLTDGFVSDYKQQRTLADGGSSRNTRKDGKHPSASTINRDLAALRAFLNWCEDVKGLTVVRPKIKTERESAGRMRWLSPDEIRAVRKHAGDWWPLFATLIYTGMRVGEAQGLVWADVRLQQRRISIHEQERRVKTASSVRDVPVPKSLVKILREWGPAGPGDLVFPAPYNDYDKTRAAWRRTCKAAGLHNGGAKPEPNARLHDLRHTYGVMAAQAGIPLPRVQRILGHATPHMTLRYMAHAPEAYFEEDSDRIDAAVAGMVERRLIVAK